MPPLQPGAATASSGGGRSRFKTFSVSEGGSGLKSWVFKSKFAMVAAAIVGYFVSSVSLTFYQKELITVILEVILS